MSQEGTFVQFTESDLLRNRTLPPGWYLLQIEKVNPWTPAKPPSTTSNMIVECTVLKNVDDNSEENKGVPVELMFNSHPKALGNLEAFLRGLGISVDPGRYNMNEAVGQTVIAHMKTEVYEGRTNNKPSHQYRQVAA